MKKVLSILFMLVVVLAVSMQSALARDRMFGMAVAETPAVSFEDSLKEVRRFGTGYVTLPLYWDELETAPARYDPDPDWLAVADFYYPLVDLPYALEINPIDTVADRRPLWLRNKSWDDPEVIGAFSALLENVFSRTGNSDLLSVNIGNEVDVFLNSDQESWMAYREFLRAATEKIHALRPGVPVTVKTTYDALLSPWAEQARAIHSGTDIVSLTYYGLDSAVSGISRFPGQSVAGALETMTTAFPGRTIHLAEIGFPSGSRCFGGEKGQVQFVKDFFAAWDMYADQVTHANWVWMYDVPERAVSNFSSYYGVSDPCFSEYLATLGLKRLDGSSKPAFNEIARQAGARFTGENR